MAQDSLAHSRGISPVDRRHDQGSAPSVEPGRLVAEHGVEILAAPDHLVTAAVRALGWDGVVLAPTVLIGRRISVIAELDVEVHERRVAAGWRPVTDRTSVATWSWSEMADIAPAPAVRLHGVLAPARHWRTALTATAPFTGLCPTAMLLPANIARDADCLTYAEHHGPAVVAAAGEYDPDRSAVDVVHGGRSGRVLTTQAAAISRWMHELVYERLLTTEV